VIFARRDATASHEQIVEYTATEQHIRRGDDLVTMLLDERSAHSHVRRIARRGTPAIGVCLDGWLFRLNNGLGRELNSYRCR
jgi:hypothetical protein